MIRDDQGEVTPRAIRIKGWSDPITAWLEKKPRDLSLGDERVAAVVPMGGREARSAQAHGKTER